MAGPAGIIRIANCYSGFYTTPNSPGKRGIHRFKTVLSRLLLATSRAFSQLKSDLPLLKMLEKDFGPDGKGKMSPETMQVLEDKGFALSFFPARNQAVGNGYFGLKMDHPRDQLEFEKARSAMFRACVRNIEMHSYLMGIEFVGLREQKLSEAELKVLLARVCVEHNPDVLGRAPIEESIGKVTVLEDGNAKMPDSLTALPDGRMHLKITRAKLQEHAVYPPEFGIELEEVKPWDKAE